MPLPLAVLPLAAVAAGAAKRVVSGSNVDGDNDHDDNDSAGESGGEHNNNGINSDNNGQDGSKESGGENNNNGINSDNNDQDGNKEKGGGEESEGGYMDVEHDSDDSEYTYETVTDDEEDDNKNKRGGSWFGFLGGDSKKKQDEEMNKGGANSDDDCEEEDIVAAGYNSSKATIAAMAGQFICRVCDMELGTKKSYDEHIRIRHMKKLTEVAAQQESNVNKNQLQKYKCKLCGVTCGGESVLKAHIAGKKHQKKLAIESTRGQSFVCKICDMTLGTNKSYDSHISGKKHKKKLAEVAAHGDKEETEQEQSYVISPSPTETTIAKIEIEDSSADIITFKDSISGKASLTQEGEHTSLFNFRAGSFSQLSISEQAATLDDVAASLFLPKAASNVLQKNKGLSLCSSSSIDKHSEVALFGHLFNASEQIGEAVYINTHEPFCFITVGVQGAGKSHTSSCILESCLVPFEPGNICKLNAPMTSMVLHYDQNISSICEAAGLLSPNPSVKAIMGHVGHEVGAVPKDKSVILVSPAYYKQRKKFYGDDFNVKPLLFRWRSLTADHIKRIMRIESGDNQLYVASFLDLLRSYQQRAVVPEFSDFLKQVRKVCNVMGQKGPLDQRISLLESVVAESEKNTALVGDSLDLISCSKNGYYFIIADLTDPLLSKEEANGLFQVLTEQFRTLSTKGGKVLCFDEAHKYMTGEKKDGLSEAIVNAARLMRHDGMRLVVSTQSPKALAPELLELVTLAVLHHFHSPDWWQYLQSKLPLHDSAFERILSLSSGEAVAFATSHDLTEDSLEGSHCLPMRIRPRITEDLGSSRRNS